MRRSDAYSIGVRTPTEAQMVDAFFWYTGLVFWISVFAAVACFAAADASDRKVRHRSLRQQRWFPSVTCRLSRSSWRKANDAGQTGSLHRMAKCGAANRSCRLRHWNRKSARDNRRRWMADRPSIQCGRWNPSRPEHEGSFPGRHREGVQVGDIAVIVEIGLRAKVKWRARPARILSNCWVLTLRILQLPSTAIGVPAIQRSSCSSRPKLPRPSASRRGDGSWYKGQSISDQG